MNWGLKVENGLFPHYTLFDVPAEGNLSKFLDETYVVKLEDGIFRIDTTFHAKIIDGWFTFYEGSQCICG